MGKSCKVTSRLEEFRQRKERQAVRLVAAAVRIGGSNAAVYTPIATSNLLNSQYSRVIQAGTKVVGQVGYTAEYAWHVHNPEVRQVFTRATARKEFLRLGFEDSRDLIDGMFRREMKA